MKIVSRHDSTLVLWEGDSPTIREAVMRAVASGANLSGADLRGADLRVADLSGANLHVADGVVSLPVGDPRGYVCVAVWTDTRWIIYAGCRRFTAEEAAGHWGESYMGERAIGDRYLFALGCLTGVQPPRADADAEVAA